MVRWVLACGALVALMGSAACHSASPDGRTNELPTARGTGAATRPVGGGTLVPQFGGPAVDSWMVFDHTGRYLASQSEGGITLWDVENKTQARFIPFRPQRFDTFPPQHYGWDKSTLAFSPDGRFVARVPVFEPVNAAHPRSLPDTWEIATGEPVGSADWFPDGTGFRNLSFPWTLNELQAWRTLSRPDEVARASSYRGEGHFFTNGGSRVITIAHGAWPNGITTLRILATANGSELLRREFPGVFHFAGTADGRWLALTDVKNGLRLLSLPTGEERLLKVPAPTGPHQAKAFTTRDGIQSLAFSPDGKRFALSTVNFMAIFDMATLTQTVSIPAREPYGFRRLAFGPKGSHLAVGTPKGIQIWDATSGKEYGRFEPQTCPVTALVVSPDSQSLASATCEPAGGHPRIYLTSGVKLWDLSGNRPPRTVARHERSVRAVAFTPDGQRLLVGTSDRVPGNRSETQEGEVVVWDLATGERTPPTLTENGWQSSASAVGVSGAGHRYAAVLFEPLPTESNGMNAYQLVEYEAILQEWDAKTGDAASRVRLGGGMDFTFSPDTRRIARSQSDRVEIVDSRTGRRLRTLTDSDWNKFIPPVWFPDGGLVAIALKEHWSAGAWMPKARYRDNAASEILRKSTIELWNSTTGRRHARLEGEVDAPLSLAVNADGSRVAAGDCEGRVTVWAKPEWRRVSSSLAHEGCVGSLAFRGDTLFSGGDDGFIRIWNPEGASAGLMATDANGVDWIVAAPDGRYDGTSRGAHTLIGFREGTSAWPAASYQGAVLTAKVLKTLLPSR